MTDEKPRCPRCGSANLKLNRRGTTICGACHSELKGDSMDAADMAENALELDTARLAGSLAHRRGLEPADNPFEDGDPQRDAWLDGFERAERRVARYG